MSVVLVGMMVEGSIFLMIVDYALLFCFDVRIK